MKRSLVLFTTNHPFRHTGGETMFVGPELPHLLREFGHLCLVPLHDDGTAAPLPAGTEVDRRLAQGWRRCRVWHYLCAWRWPGFMPELRRGLRCGGWIGAARVWRWAAVADATWRWMGEALAADDPSLLYTYWRGGQTLAAARWVTARPQSRAVSRVHRYELYEEAFSPPFQPWTALYRELALVVTVAQQGADYLRDKQVDAARTVVSRLGVAAGLQRSAASRDGVLRIVSCSNVVPVKRVDRILRALVALARSQPQRRIEWTHYGGGPGLPALREAAMHVPVNLHIECAGEVPNPQVLAHYRERPVDLMVLLSSSEGLPVAIQEALAHGVPVLATDVGGVAEAVDRSGDNGALMAADAAPEAIAAAIERLWLADDAEVAARREAAFRRWSTAFDADRNHAALASLLAQC